MGELEEKESAGENRNEAPENQQPIESKETDKMLQQSDNHHKKPTAMPPTGAEEIINIPEPVAEKEEGKRDGNGDGEIRDGKKDRSDSKKLLAKEDREVKPKKIPIGGMKLPGFFTKAKPQKAEGDGADGELLEKEVKEEEIVKEKKTEEKPPCLGDRIRNFFARKKKQPAAAAGAEEAKNGEYSCEIFEKIEYYL